MTRRKQKPGSIWDHPLYYDIALSYRDYRSDVLQILLIQSVGKWETVGFYGSLHEDIPLDHARAEQMVCILKKA